MGGLHVEIVFVYIESLDIIYTRTEFAKSSSFEISRVASRHTEDWIVFDRFFYRARLWVLGGTSQDDGGCVQLQLMESGLPCHWSRVLGDLSPRGVKVE